MFQWIRHLGKFLKGLFLSRVLEEREMTDFSLSQEDLRYRELCALILVLDELGF